MRVPLSPGQGATLITSVALDAGTIIGVRGTKLFGDYGRALDIERAESTKDEAKRLHNITSISLEKTSCGMTPT
jgi:hypothetical protein